MAIYSLDHDFVGRSKQKQPFTAAAHINYITRTSATTEILAEHMPLDRHQAKRWMHDQEVNERFKNARMIDKVLLALPIEFTHEQNVAVVQDFAREMSSGRCPWYAVIHSNEMDAKNPHAHMVFRDRDIETGKRFMMTTDKNSTLKFRAVWEHVCNAHLAANGFKQRISRDTLEEQGIDRIPQKHVGPKSQHAAKRGYKLKSKERDDTIKIGQKKARKIPYPEIDQGRTRWEFNEHIIDLNLERMKRSPDYATQQRADYEISRRNKIRELLKNKDAIKREYREKRGKLWDGYQNKFQHVKKTHYEERDAHLDYTKLRFKPDWREFFDAKRKAFRDFDDYEKNFSSLLAKDVKYYWDQLDTTQDKTRGRLSEIFKRNASTEDKKQALSDHFDKEEKKILKNYNSQKYGIRRIAKRKYSPDYDEAKNDWLEKKEQLKGEFKEKWDEYFKESKSLRRDIEAERRNLEGFLEDYQKQTSATGTGPSQEQDPSPSQSEADRKREEILKRMRDLDKDKGGGDRGGPDHDR